MTSNVRSYALTLTEGREVKHTGDGIMASFALAHMAVACAMRIQTNLTTQTFGPFGSGCVANVAAAS